MGLSLAEPFYAAAAAWDGRRRERRRVTLDAPVVSVGNLTCGGTGKTPVVAWIANWLAANGHSPGLLSRGYRSLEESDGEGNVGNDEKRVLATLCPGVPHVQQRDRIAAGRRLIGDGCDVLVLDDGFQYRQLGRAVDLVVIDATQPWGYGHCLPRGLLREPKAGLRRATHVLINRVGAVDSRTLETIKGEVAALTDKAVMTADVQPVGLLELGGGRLPLESLLAGALPFCGLGNPAGFAATLRKLGVEQPPRAFPDHHHYAADDVRSLREAAAARGVSQVVCTQKDLVKLRGFDWGDVQVVAVEIALTIRENESALVEALRALRRNESNGEP